jgi:hypothetical protein
MLGDFNFCVDLPKQKMKTFIDHNNTRWNNWTNVVILILRGFGVLIVVVSTVLDFVAPHVNSGFVIVIKR